MAIIFIANRPWSPGTQLTDQQMLAISAGIQIGVQYSADVLAQFEAQGGQAASAGILSAIASAGNLVNDDARATVPNSRTQAPESGPLLLNADGRIEPPPDTNSSSNAISSEPSTFLQNVDTGLDSPVRRIGETQSTSQGDNEQGGPLLLNADVDGRENFDGSPAVSSSVGGRPGAGSATDDAGSARITRAEND